MTRFSDSRQASSIRCADQHPDFYALHVGFTKSGQEPEGESVLNECGPERSLILKQGGPETAVFGPDRLYVFRSLHL
jgi:hypothetical protein